MDVEQPTYRMTGIGLTRLVLGEDYLLAGQPRNGYRERKIPLAMIDGFCIEPMSEVARQRAERLSAGFNGDFVLAFRDGDKRRVYRLAIDLEDPAFQAVVARLGERRSDADLTRLPPREALARMKVPSAQMAGLWIVAVVLGGVGAIVLVMWIMWRSR